MTDKQIDINNQVEVGLNLAKELLELYKEFENMTKEYRAVIPTYLIENRLFYFFQRADWLNVCFNLLDKERKQLKAKEQECEELKNIINEAKNSKLDLKSFLVGEAVQNEYEQQLDQLKAENDELKKIIERLDVPKHEVIDMDIALENEKLKAVLTEIKPILELYANSKVGEEQSDGTYKLTGGIWDSFGFCTTTYDPRPAKQALQKISECEANQ